VERRQDSSHARGRDPGREAGGDGRDGQLRAELVALAAQPDAARARDRLWEILDDRECWPGRRLVGDDGAEAAWLIAQRAIDDVGLQRRCLEMLEWAVDLDDADPVQLAYLHDRVRMHDGRDQLYGSQLVLGDDGTLTPWPVDDPAAVDQRRRRLGLPPLAAHVEAMNRRWEDQAGGGESAARQQYHAATDR
jgi:hypothetical protein